MNFTADVLIESQSARSQGLEKFKAQQSEERILKKVKLLMFAVWKGVGRVSRHQLADFYEVSVETIDKNHQRHKSEFDLDGVEVLRGEALRDVRDIMSLTSRSPAETIYTAAGALRMGFILRDSPVAKEVRSAAIRFIQGVGGDVSPGLILGQLSASYPVLSQVREGNRLRVSAPYAPYWDKMKSTFKRNHPNGGIPGMSFEDIRRKLQLCSAYTDNFKLQGIKELQRTIAGETRGQYPHLISDTVTFEVNQESGTAIFMFQVADLIWDLSELQECLGRDYITTAKSDLQIDRVYLIFLAPFGVTAPALDYIEKYLRPDYKGSVGALTVKELADSIHTQAWSTRQLGIAKGKITQEFSILQNYEFPEIPDVYEQLNIFDVS